MFRFVLIASALILAGVLADFGIVDLIAQGYGTIAWGFLFVFLIPLFTVGLYRLTGSGSEREAGEGIAS